MMMHQTMLPSKILGWWCRAVKWLALRFLAKPRPMTTGWEGRLTQDPRCPRCSAMLAETLTAKELEVEVGDEQRKVRIAYCGRCGSAVGLLA